MVVDAQSGVSECEKLLEATEDLDGAGSERKTVGTALVQMCGRRTKRLRSERNLLRWTHILQQDVSTFGQESSYIIFTFMSIVKLMYYV